MLLLLLAGGTGVWATACGLDVNGMGEGSAQQGSTARDGAADGTTGTSGGTNGGGTTGGGTTAGEAGVQDSGGAAGDGGPGSPNGGDGSVEGGPGDGGEGGVSDGAAPDAGNGGEGGSGGPLCLELGAVSQNGHCYVPVILGATWGDARNACQALIPSAHLVTITSAAEQTIVDGLLANTDNWIGLTRDADAGADAGSSFYWITGEGAAYQNWRAGEPTGDDVCVRAVGNGANTGKWADRSCTMVHPYICERE